MLLNEIWKENLFKQLTSVKLLSTRKWLHTVVNSKYTELCMIWKSRCICARECVCDFHHRALIYNWRSIVNIHLFCWKYGTLENTPELITNTLVIIKNANELLGYFSKYWLREVLGEENQGYLDWGLNKAGGSARAVRGSSNSTETSTGESPRGSRQLLELEKSRHRDHMPDSPASTARLLRPEIWYYM